MIKTILYLHGFRSGPQSAKSGIMRRACSERGINFIGPQLPDSPAQAAQDIARVAVQLQPSEVTVVGSSLGGFYATWLAEQIACKAVLLNPAVDPVRDLAAYVADEASPLTRFHSDESFVFRPQYLDELKAMTPGALADPSRYLLIAATGDEVLDWQEMAARYKDAQQLIVQGSNHGLSGFDQYLTDVFDFAGSAALARGQQFAHKQPEPSDQVASERPAGAIQRVSDALEMIGLGRDIVQLDSSARTALQAAESLRVLVGQIAKSLVFRGKHTGAPVLVICAGDRRVDEEKLGTLLGQPVERASAAFVREHTGFAIGGVAPVGHPKPLHTLFDESLCRFTTVWAAGGTPHAVFAFKPLHFIRQAAVQLQDVTSE
jgi:uncharacterized protein